MEINVIGWNPNLTYFVESSTWLPTSIKDWLINTWNKIYFYISSIWNWFTDYLSYILSKILDILKGSKPNPKDEEMIPEKYKFKDIHNKEYIDNLIQTLDDYKLYILSTLPFYYYFKNKNKNALALTPCKILEYKFVNIFFICKFVLHGYLTPKDPDY